MKIKVTLSLDELEDAILQFLLAKYPKQMNLAGKIERIDFDGSEMRDLLRAGKH